LRLAITASGGFKGELNADRILEIDGDTLSVMKGSGRPSAETALHVEIVRARSAGAVLHTHSVWSTVLSEAHAPEGGLAIQGFEMLKGLEGVTTHEHREWLPILDNDQDMDRLAVQVQRVLREHPACHGFLLRRHGLYTWGDTLPQAVRHVEILEFLLETVGRSSGRTSWPS
jgi:methylthioribulose-1-phosphate dehydratase